MIAAVFCAKSVSRRTHQRLTVTLCVTGKAREIVRCCGRPGNVYTHNVSYTRARSTEI